MNGGEGASVKAGTLSSAGRARSQPQKQAGGERPEAPARGGAGGKGFCEGNGDGREQRTTGRTGGCGRWSPGGPDLRAGVSPVRGGRFRRRTCASVGTGGGGQRGLRWDLSGDPAARRNGAYRRGRGGRGGGATTQAPTAPGGG